PDQNVSFGFTDAQAKATYDVTSRQQVQVAMTAGVSKLGRDSSLLGAGSLRDADNQSTVVVGTWRSVWSPAFTVSQRFAVAQNSFQNLSRDGVDLDSGDGHDIVYRADVVASPSSAVLIETGGEARWSAGIGREQRLSGGRFQVREDFDGTASATSL